MANKLTGKYEDEYMKVVGRYRQNKERPKGQRPCDYFAEAWSCLLKETHEYGHDVLGEIYESQISFGEHGQFFTPVHITDVMCQVVGSPSSGQTVNDPTCGSGRFFISMGKLNKDVQFVGMDIAPVCVKMTTLNMWLFDLDADIYCDDTLEWRFHQVYRTRKSGYVFENAIKEMPEPVKIEMKKQVRLREQETLFDLADLKKKAA